ncbi:hypothetical protein ATERTT37_006745 [Aspergillus terreus]
MVRLEDSALLSQDARDEFENPLPQKHCDDGRIIYLSRNNYGPLKDIVGLVEITDFDLAVHGDSPQDGCIQAEVYRAPEVILDQGPAPKDLVGRGKRTSMFYTAAGTLKNPDIVPSTFSFESTLSKFNGEEKKMFINFVSRMIKWNPEERSTAKELLQDPWLHNDYTQI